MYNKQGLRHQSSYASRNYYRSQAARQILFPGPTNAGNADAYANPLPHQDPRPPSPQFVIFDDLVFLYKMLLTMMMDEDMI
jgi:hypothetical protein